MAKEINVESIVNDKQLDKILQFLMEVTKISNESSDKLPFEDRHPEAYKMVTKEMDRLSDLLKKTDPKEHEYYTLLTNYKSLLGIIDKHVY